MPRHDTRWKQLTWSMVTTASGALSDEIALTNKASKGKNGGREIPMHPALCLAHR